MSLVRLELATVAHVTLDNPPLNLVTRDLLIELGAALDILEGSFPGDVRAVVVTGAGERAFSAGSHVKEFESQRGPEGRERHALESGVADRLAGLPMPTIAAIEGNALGGGLELALCCDIRVASEQAKLGLPEVRLAVTPGAGGTQRLPRVVGVGRAKEMTLTGRIIDAHEAERIGLVSMVCEENQLQEKSLEVARKLAGGAQTALRWTKSSLNNWLRMAGPAFDASLAYEMLGFTGPEAKEGIASHREKRAPKFPPEPKDF